MAVNYRWRKFRRDSNYKTETKYKKEWKQKSVSGSGYSDSEEYRHSITDRIYGLKDKGLARNITFEHSKPSDGYDWTYSWEELISTPYTSKILSHYSKGSYIEDVTSNNRNAYPDNNYKDSYWYEYVGIDNQAPVISGSNLDLGSKTSNFDIEYIITDADGDDVSVDIFEDSVKKVRDKAVTLGTKNYYRVDLSKLTLGRHTIRILAKDSKLEFAFPRTYTFYKSNSAPIISGEDRDLGNKNTAFTETFTVKDSDNDSVSVIVTLNGVEIKSISNANAQEQNFTISDEMLKKLDLDVSNEIVIRADDSKGGVTYRRLTFKRVNRPPIISGSDRDLGTKDKKFNFEFSVTDIEKDAISYKVFIDGKKIYEKENVTDGENQVIEISQDMFVRLKKGEHTIKVIAKDSKDASSERIVTFTKKVNKLEFILKVKETDVAAKKILVILNSIIADGDVVTIKACNNYNDTNPTWEDITKESLGKLAYNYKNKTKTASKFYIAIWVKVEKKSDESYRSIVRGLSGGFE